MDYLVDLSFIQNIYDNLIGGGTKRYYYIDVNGYINTTPIEGELYKLLKTRKKYGIVMKKYYTVKSIDKETFMDYGEDYNIYILENSELKQYVIFIDEGKVKGINENIKKHKARIAVRSSTLEVQKEKKAPAAQLDVLKAPFKVSAAVVEVSAFAAALEQNKLPQKRFVIEENIVDAAIRLINIEDTNFEQKIAEESIKIVKKK